MNNLLKGKGNSFCWNQEHQEAFESLIKHATEAPVLGFADFHSPFILQVDASFSGLGAMLVQEQEGERKVIGYASRSLSVSEQRYPVHKLEFLALKWAVTEKFHDYLYGVPFEVVTDNNPLTYVLSSAKLDATSHRWVAALAAYNFSIRYQPGSQNVCADFLSRMSFQSQEMVQAALQRTGNDDAYCLSGMTVVPEDVFSLPSVRPYDMASVQDSDPILSQVISLVKRKRFPSKKEMQGKPVEFAKIMRQWDKLRLRSGVLYREARIDGSLIAQLVVPMALRQELLTALHDDMGHVGRDRTVDLVRQRAYWPGWYKDCCSRVESCRNCICRKAVPDKAPMVPIETCQPLELVCLDYLSLEPSGNYANVLVITDHFSKFAVAVPTRNQTAKTTARVLYNEFVVHYGIPSRLHNDQGANFMSSTIKELCELLNIKQSRTTPYHPMGNGLCERLNRTFLNMLGCLEEDKKKSWKEHLPTFVHAYNCTRHASTGFTPYELMFGRTPSLPVDVKFGMVKHQEKQNYSEFISELQKSLQSAWASARNNQGQSSERQTEEYDKRRRGFALEVGDLVLVKQVGFKGPHKLANHWEKDPYIVLERPDPTGPVYIVKQSSGRKKKTLHRNMLLPVAANWSEASSLPKRNSASTEEARSFPHRSPSSMVPVISDNPAEDDWWHVVSVPSSETTQPATSDTSSIPSSDTPDLLAAASPDVEVPEVSRAESPVAAATPLPRRSTRTRRPPQRYSELEW